MPQHGRRLCPLFSGESHLVTCWVVGREPILREATTVHLLRNVLNQVKHRHPFWTWGYVILPDHLHLLLTPKAHTLGQIVEAILEGFTDDYQQMMGIPGKMAIWQPGFRSQIAADVDSFATCLDFVHFNPVHHRLVRRPEDWPTSSYPHWVERKLYKLGWGWTIPSRLAKIHWE
ncbi:MAG: hypothetical protein HC802_20305 [Caldilineaceae bacterium]|nr:hypothetical protein [Caldilineaceae bacterium]